MSGRDCQDRGLPGDRGLARQEKATAGQERYSVRGFEAGGYPAEGLVQQGGEVAFWGNSRRKAVWSGRGLDRRIDRLLSTNTFPGDTVLLHRTKIRCINRVNNRDTGRQLHVPLL